MPNVQEMLAKAMQFHQSGNLDAARDEYARILEAEPENADAAHLLGILLLGEGNAEEALRHLGTAVNAAPGIAEFRSTRAVALIRLGRMEEAVSEYSRAVEINPDDPGLFYNLGLAFSQMGEFPRARSAFEKAVSLKPDLAEAHGNLGLVLQELGNPADAIAAHENALKCDPDSPGLLNNWGLALQEADRTSEALSAFERAIELEPENSQAQCNRGNILCEMEDWDAAASAYSAALAQIPDFAEAQFGLGYIAFKTGDEVNAAIQLAESLRNRPGDLRALAYYSLVESHARSEAKGEPLVDLSTYPTRTDLGIPEPDLEELRSFVKDHPSLRWEPHGKSTRDGSQTARIAESGSGPMDKLVARIRKWLDEHFRAIDPEPGHPHRFRVPGQYGLAIWATVLVRQGRQLAHIHPNGWLSGVVYLTGPNVENAQDRPRAGWFEVGRFDPGSEPKEAGDSVFVAPKPGLMVTFPSYYFHRTVPFEGQHERISIAFDVEPLTYRYG